MKKNSDKKICKENERMKFYSLYFDILKYKEKKTIYKGLGESKSACNLIV